MTTTVLLLSALLPPSVFAADDEGTLYPEGTIDKQALERILPDKPLYSPYADLNFPARCLATRTCTRHFPWMRARPARDSGRWKQRRTDGGDLPNAPEGKAPTFLVAALKDPIGANLDRYQIVKGWLDSKGKLHE
jgi:hypothetical protein